MLGSLVIQEPWPKTTQRDLLALMRCKEEGPHHRPHFQTETIILSELQFITFSTLLFECDFKHCWALIEINPAYSQLKFQISYVDFPNSTRPKKHSCLILFSIFYSKVGGRLLFSRENFTTGSTPKTKFRSKQTTYPLFTLLPMCLWVTEDLPLFLPWQRKQNLFTNAQAIAMETNMR